MTIKTRLDPEVHAAAKAAAARKGVSLTEYLRRLVQSDLEARNLSNGSESPINPGNRTVDTER
jgi:hypothetical protein